MDPEKLVKVIKEVLSEIVNDHEVKSMDNSATLKEEIGLDSMSSLTFLLALEEKLKFTVDPLTLSAADFQSIETISNYIMTQLNKKSISG